MTVRNALRKQPEVRKGGPSVGGECGQVSVGLGQPHAPETLPWTVFVGSRDPADAARQKRNMKEFANLENLCQSQIFSAVLPMAVWPGQALPPQGLGDFHLVGPALSLGSHIPQASSCTLEVLTHHLLLGQVTIFRPRLKSPAALPLTAHSPRVLGVRTSHPPHHKLPLRRW